VNFISEGFLHRYTFSLKKKSSGLFSSILKGIAIGVGVVALAAATVFTAGAAGALAAGVALSGAITAGATAVTTAAAAVLGATTVAAVGGGLAAAGITAAAVGLTVGATIATAGAIQEIRYGISSMIYHNKKELKGRDTEIPPGYKRVENDDSRKLTQSYLDRLIIKDQNYNINCGILCPDYEVNQPYFNSIFTGNEHYIELTKTQGINELNGLTSNYFSNDTERHFYIPSYYDNSSIQSYTFKIVPVGDNVKCAGVDDTIFRARAGEAEEAWRYECIGEDYKSDQVKGSSSEDEETISNKKINSDIIRGSFGPYLAINNL